MASFIEQIVDAVVTALNSTEFSQEFTAVKEFLPVSEVKDLINLKVSVVPALTENTRANRKNTFMSQHTINIGVAQKISQDSDIAILLTLSEEINDHLRALALVVDSTDVICETTRFETLYSAELLREKRVFLSVITANFLAYR